MELHPKVGNNFNPSNFLNEHFKKDNVIVIDSDNLGDDWEENVKRQTNLNTKYRWERTSDNLRAYEDHDEHEDNDTEDDQYCHGCAEEQVLECDKDRRAEEEEHDYEDTSKSHNDEDRTKDKDNDYKDTSKDNNEDGDDANDNNARRSKKKSTPKRVLIWTTKKLLRQLSKNLKTSVDGTFKSCCKLWGQSFIWMVKQRGYWVPVVWGWLPDKSEIYYKVFFLLVKQKMEDFGMGFSIESVISDFELNIMKAIDEMLLVDILGCFFHLKKVFKYKVDKKGFKKIYDNDHHFRSFVNACSAIAHLPMENIELALDVIEEKFQFEDDKVKSFKSYFMKFIRDYWINGCYPPQTWNCFSRPEDATNNNQVIIIIIKIFIITFP